MDGAGVDLLTLVNFRQKPPSLQHLGADGGDIHEGLWPLGSFLRPIDLLPGGQIPVIGGLDRRIVDLHVVQMGGERGVAAVVGPVGVHHPDLRQGGVPALRVPEVCLEERQVLQVHGETQPRQQGIQARPVQGSEARDRFHVCRDGGLCRQPLRQVQRRLPALHGVEDIPLHRVHIRRRQGTEEQIDPGGADRGPLLLSHQLNTLGGGVRPLVELSRQGLHAEGDAVPGGQGCGSIVHLRLREHCPHRPAEGGLVQALHVIAVQQAQVLQGGDAHHGLQLVQQAPGLLPEPRLLFHIDPSYHRMTSRRRLGAHQNMRFSPPEPPEPAGRCHGAGICRQSPPPWRRRRRRAKPAAKWDRWR